MEFTEEKTNKDLKILKDQYDKVKKSVEVESAVSNIRIVRGDEDEGDELDLGTEKVSAEDAPFVKLVIFFFIKLLYIEKIEL